MSQANNPIKVLIAARKRLVKGWTQDSWAQKTKTNGKITQMVCMEGAITNGHAGLGVFFNRRDEDTRAEYHWSPTREGLHITEPMCQAAQYTLEAIIETQAAAGSSPSYNDTTTRTAGSIPNYNDASTRTLDEVLAVIDLAITKAEADAGVVQMLKSDPGAYEIDMPEVVGEKVHHPSDPNFVPVSTH